MPVYTYQANLSSLYSELSTHDEALAGLVADVDAVPSDQEQVLKDVERLTIHTATNEAKLLKALKDACGERVELNYTQGDLDARLLTTFCFPLLYREKFLAKLPPEQLDSFRQTGMEISTPILSSLLKAQESEERPPTQLREIGFTYLNREGKVCGLALSYDEEAPENWLLAHIEDAANFDSLDNRKVTFFSPEESLTKFNGVKIPSSETDFLAELASVIKEDSVVKDIRDVFTESKINLGKAELFLPSDESKPAGTAQMDNAQTDDKKCRNVKEYVQKNWTVPEALKEQIKLSEDRRRAEADQKREIKLQQMKAARKQAALDEEIQAYYHSPVAILHREHLRALLSDIEEDCQQIAAHAKKYKESTKLQQAGIELEKFANELTQAISPLRHQVDNFTPPQLESAIGTFHSTVSGLLEQNQRLLETHRQRSAWCQSLFSHLGILGKLLQAFYHHVLKRPGDLFGTFSSRKALDIREKTEQLGPEAHSFTEETKGGKIQQPKPATPTAPSPRRPHRRS